VSERNNRDYGCLTLTMLLLLGSDEEGQLRRAAEQKADEDILQHIPNRDCVAVEVRYHRDCYMMYTKDVYSLSGIQPKSVLNWIPLRPCMHVSSYKAGIRPCVLKMQSALPLVIRTGVIKTLKL